MVKCWRRAGSDSTVRVWDLGANREPNGKPALVLRGHTSDVRSVNFHPDGTRLFSAGMDGMVKVWDVAKRDRPVILEDAVSFLSPFAFNVDSGRIVTFNPKGGGGGKPAGPAKAGKENKVAPIPPEAGKDFNVTPRRLEKVKVWDVSGKPLGSFAGPIPSAGFGSSNHPIALNRDGTRMAIVCFLGSRPKPEGAELHIIEVDSGKQVFVRKLGPTNYWTHSLALSRDGKQLAWGFNTPVDGTVPSPRLLTPDAPRSIGPSQVLLLNSSDGAEIRRIALPEVMVDSLAFSPDGKRLVVATGGLPSHVTIWDTRTGERLFEIDGIPRQSNTTALVFSDDGARLAGIVGVRGIGGRLDVVVWDAATGKKLFSLPGHSGNFTNVAFSPNGRRIATAAASGSPIGAGPPGSRSGNEVKLWDATTGNELMTLKDLDRNSARYLSFSADGYRLYAVGVIGSGPEEKLEIRSWDATPRDAK